MFPRTTVVYPLSVSGIIYTIASNAQEVTYCIRRDNKHNSICEHNTPPNGNLGT